MANTNYFETLSTPELLKAAFNCQKRYNEKKPCEECHHYKKGHCDGKREEKPMIKYHDNTNGEQYDRDGVLTNNWDSQKEYPENAFAKVHFRIDCPCYDFSNGFSDEKSKSAFYAEIVRVLEKYAIPEAVGLNFVKGMEYLYIHPQDISGVVQKNKIRMIAEDLSKCQTCSIRWVDVYHDVSDMSDQDFRDILSGRKDEIEKDVLEAFRTKRKDLYIVYDPFGSPLAQISKKYSIYRKSNESGIDHTCLGFLNEILQSLVQSGKIAQAETRHGTGYRTATPETNKGR